MCRLRFNTLAVPFLGLATAVIVVMVAFPGLINGGRINRGSLCLAGCTAGSAERECGACTSWFQSVLDADEDNCQARRALANIALWSGQFAEAEEMLGDLWESPGGNVLDLYRFALLDSVNGWPDDWLIEALRGRIPSQFFFWVARQYEIEQRPAWDIAARRLAYALDEEWKDEWSRAFNARKIGRWFAKRGDFGEARQAYALALENFRADGDIESIVQISRIYWSLGQMAEQEGDFEAAVDAYRRSMRNYPKEALGSYLSLGLLLKSQGYSLDEIEQEFKRFLSADSSRDPYVYAWPLNVLVRLDSPSHARHFLEMAGPAQRETSVMLALTARLLRAEGKARQAEIHYRQAIQKARNANPREAAKAASELAGLLSEQGDLDGSLEMWELATTLLPEEAWYWYGLGCVEKERGALDAARSALRQALQLDSSLSEAQTLLQQIEQ